GTLHRRPHRRVPSRGERCAPRPTWKWTGKETAHERARTGVRGVCASGRGPMSESSLSRAEIETLCVLHVIGMGGCGATELAIRLGLAETLAGAVADAVTSFV